MTEQLVKWDWYVNPEKEEAWLNRMAADGWALSRMKWGGMRAYFTRCEPNEYQFRLELMKHPKSDPKGREYLNFLEETGIDCVYSLMGFAYLRKKADGTPFDLYTDRTSRLQQLKRKNTIYSGLGLVCFLVGIFALITGLLPLLMENILLLSGLLSGTVCTILGALFLVIGKPYRQQIRKLKAEQNPADEVFGETDKGTFSMRFWLILVGLMLLGGVIGFFLGLFSV